MPELPEVETIKKQLSKKIKDKKITKIVVRYAKIIKAPLEKFRGAVLGAKIKDVRRRAKLIIIDLSSGYSLLIHLKLTGQLIYNPRPIEQQHTHAIYIFGDGSQLLHKDLRKFGYVKLIKTENIEKILEKEYGLEPLDKKFTLAAFRKLLAKKPKQKIKQFLMDQKNIAGIGNIYADEILFYAGVRPDKKISVLTENEIKKIFHGVKKILSDAIKCRGSSVDNYVDSQGKAGEYHLRLRVYGRPGQPCLKCGGAINKIKLFGRGTHFCPKCQK